MKKQTNTFYDFKNNLSSEYRRSEDDKTVYASFNFNAICLFDKYMKGQLSAATYAIFNWFVANANFAGDNEYGGQTVKLTPAVRDIMLKELNINKRAFDRAIAELKEEELVIKRDPQIYQVNPLLFTKGSEAAVFVLQIYVLETGIIKNISSEAVLTKAQKTARQKYVNKEKERRANIVEFESRNGDIEQFIDDSKEYAVCAEKRENYILRNFM